MSHEIRTPLNAIVGFSDVIASTYNELSDEERADFVRLISINSEHLVRLIDDILDLSKIESNTIKFTYSCCSLKSMMKDIEKEQAVKQLPEIEIKALLPDDDIYINTDATRLKQVICNLQTMPANLQRKVISISASHHIQRKTNWFTCLWKIREKEFRKNARKRYSTVSIRSILSNKVRG